MYGKVNLRRPKFVSVSTDWFSYNSRSLLLSIFTINSQAHQPSPNSDDAYRMEMEIKNSFFSQKYFVLCGILSAIGESRGHISRSFFFLPLHPDPSAEFDSRAR